MKFGEKLIEAGLIDQAQLDAALSHQGQTGQMLGEALLELGYISEEDFLKFLAQEFETQFVSTEKLAKAKLDPELLQMVPVKLAEQQMLFPIILGKDGKTLGVISCEPQNTEAIDEVRIVTGMEIIQVYIAQRDTIRAMIKKHYRSDLHAFDRLDSKDQKELDQMLELYGNRVLTEEVIEVEEEAKPRSSGPAVAELEGSEIPPRDRTSSWTRAIEHVREGSLFSDNDYLETLNILVGLVEMHLPNRQGHSARVAKHVKNISEHLELTEMEVNHNITAAYLHDLGKRASSHVTLLSIGANKEHRHRAQRYHLTPSRLFDSVHLPRQVNQILSHLYENYDGSGLPEEISGEAIPLGSRIIAAVDAYDDLLNNSANLVGAILEPEQALARLEKESEILFDPQVIESLVKVVHSEAAKQTSSSSRIVLIADPDDAATAELEQKLGGQDFDVRVARDSETTLEILKTGEVSAIILELELIPDDGFFILAEIELLVQKPIVFMMASDPEPELITRAFKDGVADFITKPITPAVVVAKLNKELPTIEEPSMDLDYDSVPDLTDQAVTQPPPEDDGPAPEIVDPETGITIEIEAEDDSAESNGEDLPSTSSVTLSGVGGSHGNVISGALDGKTSLSLIRALSAKRRSGLLSLRDGDNKGEISFSQGHVFQATYKEIQGEEAFLELASWRDCMYRFDPEIIPTTRGIKTPTGKLIQIASLSA
ncbi:MAG: response regulator [Deltaproteobacteria bacterium]|nr:response regulator [Deltaproteobacteria bacterium]